MKLLWVTKMKWLFGNKDEMVIWRQRWNGYLETKMKWVFGDKNDAVI